MSAVRFFDPHPGLAGCTKPIPHLVKRVAENLDGKVMEVEDAIELIRAAVLHHEDDFTVEDHGDFISLKIGKFGNHQGLDLYNYNWRVIRYREE